MLNLSNFKSDAGQIKLTFLYGNLLYLTLSCCEDEIPFSFIISGCEGIMICVIKLRIFLLLSCLQIDIASSVLI